MFYDLFCELCSEKKISPTKASLEIGLSKSTATKWKNTGATPQGETLNKIADYFNVSVDYLLGNEQKNKLSAEAKSYSKEDLQFLNKIKKLFPENREHVENEIEFLLAGQHPKE